MFTLYNILQIVKPLIKAALILLIGHFIIVYIIKLINRGFNRSKVDNSLAAFLSKVINIALHVLVVLSALNSLGISTGGIIAAFSAAVVAVGVALKDSLGNVAGGILLLISPRFHSGDYIKTDTDEGTVIDINMLHTTIRTFDNKQISIPNGTLINSHITNYSAEETRRVDLTFSIPYETDAETAKSIIQNTILSHPKILIQPSEPFVRVISYEESSVNIITRTWCNTEDYWDVYFDLNEQIRDALKREGIDIPYNQLDVHIK